MKPTPSTRAPTAPLLSAAAAAATILLCAATSWGDPLKIACVGEQTTHSDQLNRAVEYPAMLQGMLGSSYNVQNFGDCCSTVLMGYPHQPETHPYLDGGSNPSFLESIPFGPNVVVIGSWGKHDTEIANALYAGTLDPTKFAADYELLVTTYLNLPEHPQVYLSTPIPIPKGAPTGPTTTVILPTVQASAAKHGLPIVDLYPLFLNNPSLYKDDTHPTDDGGLHTIADAVYAEIQKQLGGDASVPPPSSDAGTTPTDDGSTGSTVDATVTPPTDDGGAGSPSPSSPSAPNGDTSHGGAGSAGTSGGGCATAPGSATPGGALLALVAFAVAERRRRRRSR